MTIKMSRTLSCTVCSRDVKTSEHTKSINCLTFMSSFGDQVNQALQKVTRDGPLVLRFPSPCINEVKQYLETSAVTVMEDKYFGHSPDHILFQYSRSRHVVKAFLYTTSSNPPK